MHLSDRWFRLLELPYTDENVSMIIVLDERKDDFNMFLRGQSYRYYVG